MKKWLVAYKYTDYSKFLTYAETKEEAIKFAKEDLKFHENLFIDVENTLELQEPVEVENNT